MLKKLWVGLSPGNQELHAPPYKEHTSQSHWRASHSCPQAGGLEELPEWKADHNTLSVGSVDQGSGSLPSTVPNHGSQTHRTQPLGQR